jgi:putative oxidoreductase
MLLFVQSGLAKFFGFPVVGPPMTTRLYIRGGIEVLGGLLLAPGACTRPVAFILSGEMAAAYFIAHWPRSFFPAPNGGNMAVLFCFVFLYLFSAWGRKLEHREAMFK